jgi:hypothetical protein
MDINKAIAKEREIAGKIEHDIGMLTKVYLVSEAEVQEHLSADAAYHHQLADWLEELQQLKETK